MKQKNAFILIVGLSLGLTLYVGLRYFTRITSHQEDILGQKLKDNKLIESDSVETKNIIFNIIALLEAVRNLETVIADLDINLAQIPDNNYYETNQNRYKFSKLRMAKMSESQCQFDDIKLHFLKLNYKQEKIQSLIYLSEICSDYCHAWAQADNNFINHFYQDNLLLAQMTARKNKEISGLDANIQNICMELLQYLNEKDQELLQYYFNLKFKQELNKYNNAYLATRNSVEICMFIYEWPIISLYRILNHSK